LHIWRALHFACYQFSLIRFAENKLQAKIIVLFSMPLFLNHVFKM
jgi:hypothetical protein